jgi:hypothetical protein
MPSNQDDRLDLERSAVVRLKNEATVKAQQAGESFSGRWWDGYLRAIEHILDMENE